MHRCRISNASSSSSSRSIEVRAFKLVVEIGNFSNFMVTIFDHWLSEQTHGNDTTTKNRHYIRNSAFEHWVRLKRFTVYSFDFCTQLFSRQFAVFVDASSVSIASSHRSFPVLPLSFSVFRVSCANFRFLSFFVVFRSLPFFAVFFSLFILNMSRNRA